jgi:hypothetical protein
MPRSVYLGVHGWTHPSWTDVFYPEDLPEDWRLAYYANEFTCVWLDHEAWNSLTSKEFAAMRAEVGPEFRFVLEQAGDDEGNGAISPTDENGGISSFPPYDRRIIWFDADSDLADLAKRLTGPILEDPLYVVSQDANLAKIEAVRTLLDLLGH